MRETHREITKGARTIYARNEIEVKPVNGKSVIIEVPSESNPNVKYKVDLTLGRCSCKGWTLHAKKNGDRACCKHLKAFGFRDI